MFTVRRSLVLLLLPVLALALLVSSRATSTATPPARTASAPLADAPGAGALTLAGIPGGPSNLSTPFSVQAWSWGVSNSGTTHIGGGGGAGKANLQDLSVTIPQNTLTPLLVRAITTGQHLPTAKLVVFRPGTETPAEEYVYTDVLLSSLSTGGSAGKTSQTANLSVNFSKIEYRAFAANGTTVVNATCFNIVENVSCPS